MQFLSHDKCGFKFVLESLWYNLRFIFSEQRDQIIPQVVAYNSLKTMQNYMATSPKSSRGRLLAVVVYGRL